jgi:hypothetical protein
MKPDSRIVSVFLSYTPRGFVEERDLLVGNILPKLLRDCRERQFALLHS